MKKKYLFPTIVIAGIAAYMLLTKKNAEATTPVIDTLPPDDQTNLQDSTLDTTIKVTTPAPPAAIQYVDLFSATPGLSVMSRDGLDAYFNPIIKAIYGYKSVNLSGYTLNRLQLMYGIGQFIPYSNSQYWKAFNSMSERELGDTWNYVSTYLSKNKKLLFAENPALYNEISTIQTKYGIF